jgi:hypothetical protein
MSFKMISTVLGKTDYKRWADPRSLEAWWEPRTERVAALVPNHCRVIEFGAGNRRLEEYLDPSCTYVASDIIDRGAETIICDLNRRPLPDLDADTYDVAVLIGVLEYLRDVPSVLDWLARQVPSCVVSYVCVDDRRYSLRGMNESFRRMKMGWMNNYREEEIRSLFHHRGFVSVREDSWENNRLFLFSRRPLPDELER